jgi:hypothetical protein
MKIFFLLFLLISIGTFAQCPFTPVVTGDSMLCPQQNGTLTTGVFQNYQWYKRPIGGIAQPVSGATGQLLSINYFNDAGYYFSVAATEAGCTEMSAEVLVDGWVFLDPNVQTTGNFTIGPNGETMTCTGDTVYFTLLSPYDTNITWFNNNIPISGAISNMLPVTASGTFTVQGAPSICPNYIQLMGIPLDVIFSSCTGIIDNDAGIINLYPDPANSYIYITDLKSDGYILLQSYDGKVIAQFLLTDSDSKIEISKLPSGIYAYRIFDSAQMLKSGKITVIH